jgi:hypothetical protein
VARRSPVKSLDRQALDVARWRSDTEIKGTQRDDVRTTAHLNSDLPIQREAP